jgi:hypothetical protein
MVDNIPQELLDYFGVKPENFQEIGEREYLVKDKNGVICHVEWLAGRWWMGVTVD